MTTKVTAINEANTKIINSIHLLGIR
ncbi:hypothetical protein CY0110_17572 [Crocosphaera chwakensis CCY0110]|uniref:Uncharacterized protein n=1 Tax=Crocosphaera chwakensis CCY0110 TaxID=391612 RepID=A3IIJ6_9CHRO|nr:hypothetical protein CY0110_17572 [Crocosphaera chwakensis CCY0110]